MTTLYARTHAHSTPTHSPLSSAGAGGAAGGIRLCVCDSLRHSLSLWKDGSGTGRTAGTAVACRQACPWAASCAALAHGDVGRREGGTTSSSARLRASSCHCAWPHSRRCHQPTGRAEPLLPLTGWLQAAMRAMMIGIGSAKSQKRMCCCRCPPTDYIGHLITAISKVDCKVIFIAMYRLEAELQPTTKKPIKNFYPHRANNGKREFPQPKTG